MSRFTYPPKAYELAAQIQTADKAALPTGIFQDLGTFLQESETKLIDLMEGKQPPDSQPGEIEFGLVLYWLDTDYPNLAKWLELPPTQITESMLDQWQTVLEGPGVVYADGTLVGYDTYEQLDPGWMVAALAYILLLVGENTTYPFGTNPVTITASGDPVTVAVVGDFGTGTWTDGNSSGPAAAVMDQIGKNPADYTIHLGDVYYAGFEEEETNNLIGQWDPCGSAGTYFTLNSNHEMYDGANGYFCTALSPTGPFSAQKGTSYFAIDGGSWIIIGLDSAYYDTSLFFMQGALTDSDQLSFIKSLDLTNKKVFVMTHHNGISVDGSTQEQLFTEVVNALGRAPDFWYWGHVHNGIVYTASSAAGTYARCVGHGAIPFGNGYGLQKNDNIDNYANTPYPNPDLQQENRVLNGYALITFNSSMQQILEQFFDQEGNEWWSQTTQL